MTPFHRRGAERPRGPVTCLRSAATRGRGAVGRIRTALAFPTDAALRGSEAARGIAAAAGVSLALSARRRSEARSPSRDLAANAAPAPAGNLHPRTAGFGAYGTVAASAYTPRIFFPGTLGSTSWPLPSCPPSPGSRPPQPPSPYFPLPPLPSPAPGPSDRSGQEPGWDPHPAPRSPPRPPSRHLAAVPAHDRDPVARDMPRGMWLFKLKSLLCLSINPGLFCGY